MSFNLATWSPDDSVYIHHKGGKHKLVPEICTDDPALVVARILVDFSNFDVSLTEAYNSIMLNMFDYLVVNGDEKRLKLFWEFYNKTVFDTNKENKNV